LNTKSTPISQVYLLCVSQYKVITDYQLKQFKELNPTNMMQKDRDVSRSTHDSVSKYFNTPVRSQKWKSPAEDHNEILALPNAHFNGIKHKTCGYGWKR